MVEGKMQLAASPSALLDEAVAWAERALRNDTRASLYKSEHCRRTMTMLSNTAGALAERTARLAIDVAEAEMETRDGVPSYRAGLSFILRENSRRGPKSRAAVVAGDVT